MATVPISGTNIRLLSNVPFSNDYKNTRWFDSLAEQTSYFLSKPVVHLMANMNFQRINGFSYVSVNKSIDDLWGTNYLMFQNASYNLKWFYGFVTKLEYVQHGTTRVHFEIDVLQTWLFNMNFKPSFVVREHCQLWDANGKPIVNTVDEGLSYGHEYDNVYVENFKPNNGVKWMVIVTKTQLHGNPPTNSVVSCVNGIVQPLSYYLIPFKDNGSAISVCKPDGAHVNFDTPANVLDTIYKMSQAVNNVVALYITDYIGVPTTYHPTDATYSEWVDIPGNGILINVINIYDPNNVSLNFPALHVAHIPSYSPLNIVASTNKYSDFESVTESKLLMYPYCVTILDDFKGNRIEVKNEFIVGDSLTIVTKGSLGTSNKVSYGVENYNFSANTLPNELSNEKAIINNNPSDLPIINDNLAAFLQGNRNMIENQKTSLIFNGAMNASQGVVAGISATASRNPFGIASAGLDVVKGAGNTALELQAIEAKQQDISNVPPQISKMGSNTSYDFGNSYNGVFVIKKQIKPEYRKKLTDFFNMFGYKLHEVKIPNFHTRLNWNYVQTKGCNITGNFNNEDLQELKDVFDNGITLWHTDDVGNYSLANGVI